MSDLKLKKKKRNVDYYKSSDGSFIVADRKRGGNKPGPSRPRSYNSRTTNFSRGRPKNTLSLEARDPYLPSGNVSLDDVVGSEKGKLTKHDDISKIKGRRKHMQTEKTKSSERAKSKSVGNLGRKRNEYYSDEAEDVVEDAFTEGCTQKDYLTPNDSIQDEAEEDYVDQMYNYNDDQEETLDLLQITDAGLEEVDERMQEDSNMERHAFDEGDGSHMEVDAHTGEEIWSKRMHDLGHHFMAPQAEEEVMNWLLLKG